MRWRRGAGAKRKIRAAGLKLLHHPRQARLGISNSKAALEL
jgi:hypothetical protein